MNVKTAADDVGKTLSKGTGVINRLHRLGVRREYAGIASIGLSLVSYVTSPGSNSKALSDRRGIVVGHWAPTFTASGVALKLEDIDE